MRRLIFAVAACAALFAAGLSAAQAAVSISIDKNNQIMTVAVDGAQRYTWPVSSGLPSYETPNGSFKAFRMEADHFSKEWDDAPMPHSIFFTKSGHAIHGTDSVKRLGNPASHGCVRLSRENAAMLFALVQEQGVLNTTVTLSGASQVALARRPQRPETDLSARRQTPSQPVDIAPADQGYASSDPSVYPRDGYPRDASAYPRDTSPYESVQPRGVYPPQRRVYRRTDEAQVDGGQVYGGQVYGGQVYGGQANDRTYNSDETYFDGSSWRRGQPGNRQQYAPRPYYGPRGY